MSRRLLAVCLLALFLSPSTARAVDPVTALLAPLGPARVSLPALPGRAGEARFADALSLQSTRRRTAADPTPESVTPDPAYTVVSGTPVGALGRNIVTAGDVNGDGFSDVVSVGGTGTDVLHVYLGSNAGPVIAPGFPLILSGQSGGLAAPAGDVNGDGFGDVAITWAGATQGRLRLYLGSASGLLTTPQHDATYSGEFWGTTCAPAGDLNADGYDDLVVGAPSAGPTGTCSGGASQGRADVFYGSASGITGMNWSLQGCMWFPSGARLGADVASAGDVNADGYDDLLLGVPNADTPSFTSGAGRAYVLYGSATGLPLFPTLSGVGTLVGAGRLDSPTASASFGSSLAPAGDVNGDGYADVVVGAPDDDTFGSNAGAARVYLGGSGGITSTVFWQDFGPASNQRFGRHVAPAGDINGDGRGDVLVSMNDALFVAQAIPNTMIMLVSIGTQQSLNANPGGDVDGDGLGDVLLGEPSFLSGAGQFHVFAGRGEGPSLLGDHVYGTLLENPNFGWSVSPAGDVNGDGYDDVLVGSPTWDDFSTPGAQDNGIVFLYLGSINGLPANSSWYSYAVPNSQLGIAVAGIGDVNNDGFADFAVGAHEPSGGFGKVMVWYGGPGLPPTAPHLTLTGFAVNGYFGGALSGGDFNGDGYADLAVGASYDDLGAADGGSVRVYFGGAGGLSPVPGWTVGGTQAGEHFGSSLDGRGDIDGNGTTDLVVGAPDYDRPVFIGSLLDQGRVYEYRGTQGGLPQFVQTLGGAGNERFGASVAHAGDVDGDGFGDVVVGAPNANPTISGQGRAVVHRGSSAGLLTSVHWEQTGFEAFGAFGSSVSSAGDVDGDGLSDVLVGSVFEDDGGAQDRGVARIFRGPLFNGLPPIWTAHGAGAFANLGHAVANLGDVDGDGWNEVIGGQPGYTDVQWRQGRVEVYLGAWNEGRVGIHLARRTTSGPNVVPGGSPTNNTPVLVVYTASPTGRTQWKPEWDLRLPAAFGFAGSTSLWSSWINSTAVGPYGQLTLGTVTIPVQNGAPYWWRYRARYRDVWFPFSRWMTPVGNGTRQYDLRGPGSTWVSVDDPMGVPTTLSLSAPSPNPSRGTSRVRYALPRSTRVELAVLDVQGRMVRMLDSGERAAGEHSAAWDGTDASGRASGAGIYFYRLRAAGETIVQRAVRMN